MSLSNKSKIGLRHCVKFQGDTKGQDQEHRINSALSPTAHVQMFFKLVLSQTLFFSLQNMDFYVRRVLGQQRVFSRPLELGHAGWRPFHGLWSSFVIQRR